MSIANLYSLLNSPFYLEESTGKSFFSFLLTAVNNGFETLANETLAIETNLVSDKSAVNTEGAVAVVDLKNIIVKYDSYFGQVGTQSYIKHLNSLKNNDSISAVVLDIDSAGGQVSGTPEFYDYLKSYPKPIVAYTAGSMASAAYYIGNASSYIVANKRAQSIGAIGAFATLVDFSGIYSNQGAAIHTIYATKSTEKNKSQREVMDGNYDSFIKNELDPQVDEFISDMKATRPGIDANAFKGGSWNGEAALKMGLVDELGSLEDAIAKAFDLSNTITSNQSSTNTYMSTPKQYTELNKVLGIESIEGLTNEGAHMSESFLDSIEATLLKSETAKTEAVNEIKETLNASLNSIKSENELFSNAINSFCEKNNITKGANNTETMSAVALAFEELAASDNGATNTEKQVDKFNTTEPVYSWDINAAKYITNQNPNK